MGTDKIKISGQHKSGHSLSALRSNSFSVICLCIMAFYLVRPVLPFVEYAINKEYISKNLCINKDKPHNCCHGKCYLDEQLRKNTEPLESNKNNNKKAFPDKIVEDHLKAESVFTAPAVKIIIIICYYSTRIINSDTFPLFVPPRL